MNKYYAKKITIDNITFDSTKEASRYCELKLLLKAGKIKDLVLQPVYILQEKFDKNGRHYRAITYKADFEYYDIEKGKTIIEDTKGYKTEVYKIKKKLFEKVFPDKTITEI